MAITEKAVKTQTAALAKLSAQITVNPGTSMAKTVTISEGDIVHGLSYTDKGVPYTVDGIVTIINYSASTSSTSETACYCKRGSKFAKEIRINSLVVDSSDVFGANVNSIPLAAITGIESVNVSSLGIEGIALVDVSTLTFRSANVVPDSVLWNNEVAEFTPGEDGIYTAKIKTMLPENNLRIFSEDRFFNTTVEGITPDIDRDDCIRNSITASLTVLGAKDTDVNKQLIPVAANVGQTDSIILSGVLRDLGVTFSADEYVYIEFGGETLPVPAFVIEDAGLLKIAAPLLMKYAQEDGRVVITVNDFGFSVPATATSSSEITVSATAAGGKGGKYANVAVSESGMVGGFPGVKVEHERQDGSAYIALSAVTADGTAIPGDTIAMIFSDNSPKDFLVGTFSGLGKLYNSDAFGAFTGEHELNSGTRHYRIAIVGYGMVAAEITTTETICVFDAATADELTALLENSDAMVIGLTDDIATAGDGIRVSRDSVVINGNGHTLTATAVAKNSAGILIGADGVELNDIKVDATGDYAVKAFAKDQIILNNVTAVSHTKGAIQVNGAEVNLSGKIVLEGPWGGIEVCKSSNGAVPSLTVNAKSITCRTVDVPAIWIDKVKEDGLENAIIDIAGILTQIPLTEEKKDLDQIWYL